MMSFLSHNSRDKPAVRAIKEALARYGLVLWLDEDELQAVLRLAVKDQRPVIPVLLPGAPVQVDLPMFLRGRTWVDLRGRLNDCGIRHLVWGITGQPPRQSAPPAGHVSTSQRKSKPPIDGDNFAAGGEEARDDTLGRQAGSSELKIPAIIECELTNYLSPMAKFLVRKYAREACDIRDLGR